MVMLDLACRTAGGGRHGLRAVRALLCGLALACAGAPATLSAEVVQVDICFNYGCHHQAVARFAGVDREELRGMLSAAADAAGERAALAHVVGRMYAIAATQTPIWRDRGRNGMDERHLEGAMDCIDHSTNTEAFLRLLQSAGLLRFHQPGPRTPRFAFLVFGEHWTATLVETATASRYAVDGWFFDPGMPVAVVALERWRAGYDPENEVGASR